MARPNKKTFFSYLDRRSQFRLRNQKRQNNVFLSETCIDRCLFLFGRNDGFEETQKEQKKTKQRVAERQSQGWKTASSQPQENVSAPQLRKERKVMDNRIPVYRFSYEFAVESDELAAYMLSLREIAR